MSQRKSGSRARVQGTGDETERRGKISGDHCIRNNKYLGDDMEDVLCFRMVIWEGLSFVLFQELFITFCRQLITRQFDRASPGDTFASASRLIVGGPSPVHIQYFSQ